MTQQDQNQKKDAGKARYDLVPWGEFTRADDGLPVHAAFSWLQIWWTGRPYRLELAVPERQMRGVAEVLAFGAAKYADRGWEAGIQYGRIFAAAARHAAAVETGEHLDLQSGLPHESHFWCNVLFLAVFTSRGRDDLDNRPAPLKSTRDALDRLQALVAQTTGRSSVSAAGLVSKDGKGAN